jgi:hypothetical protein
MNVSPKQKLKNSMKVALKCFELFILLLLSSKFCLSQQTQYNKNYQIACHNCYDKQYAKNIVDVFPYTTIIEIDIWDNSYLSGLAAEKAHSTKMNGDWFVKHEPYYMGNYNCCGGTFKDCLNRIRQWTDQNINHLPITIFIDKKENWSDPNETRKPWDLDQLLLSIFPKEKIYKPSDLVRNHKNLKDAILENCQSIDSLKGKIIFIITDATIQLDIPIISPHRTPLNEYLDTQKNDALCFVAPQISSENEINQPRGFSPENSGNVVFFNLDYSNKNLAIKINALNCLCRVFGSPDETKTAFNELVAAKINFIAFDKFQIAK